MNYLSCILRLIVCLYLGFASIPAMADDDGGMAARNADREARREARKEQARIDAAKEAAAKEEEALRIRKANLKSGTLSVTSFDDAVLFYEPKDLWGVMDSPLLMPDKSVYGGKVFLDRQENENTLLVKVNDAYATLKLAKKTVNYSQEGLRIGGLMSVIGRYVKNQKYTTGFGGVKTVPVLEVMYIGDAYPTNTRDYLKE